MAKKLGLITKKTTLSPTSFAMTSEDKANLKMLVKKYNDICTRRITMAGAFRASVMLALSSSDKKLIESIKETSY